MNNNGKLTQNQKSFCEEFMVDNNATQAAIRAGYSKRSAYSTGHDNLKNIEIQKYISELKEARSLRTQVTADRVLKEITKIAFAEKGIKPGHKLKALGMLGKHVGIFDKQPNLEKQAWTRDVSKMDLLEHKNESIEFYKDIIRSRTISTEIQLTAQKQLDRFLLGLAKLYIVDPKEIAAKIIEEIKAMEESMDGPPINPEEAENGAQTQKSH
ncbi:MAG: terminase small subunit [Planctomycetes bacterium]|nr:terminase small subunit [Planctomycetota bacterium]